MKIKKFLSIFLCVVIILSCFGIMTNAAQLNGVSTQNGHEVNITTYEELKSALKNSPNGEVYVLQNDIIVEDNTNDRTIIVGALTDCTLDLNGYTLSRTTRGIDNCLISVDSGADFTIVDSSGDNSGRMIFRAGNYAGTNSVILANGNVDIYGGTFEILTPYKVGSGVVFLVEQGLLNIYDGVFDSHEAYGGDTIQLRHNAYVYDVPHCNIYGGTFYGKYSNFEVSSYSNFSKYGCFYPTVYVFDGEFYLAIPDDEYSGFAYCNNGWGQVIVAGGTVFYKCLNRTDEKYVDGVTKKLISVDYAGKTGAYYEVTPPVMIGSDELPVVERLTLKSMKKDLSYYNKYGINGLSTIYQQNQELIETVLSSVDTIEVPAAYEQSPLMWIDNSDNVKTVSWYFSDEAHYVGKDTVWSELADYGGRVNPFRFNFRPESEITLYFRALITLDDNTQVEDVVAVHYEELKANPPITSVKVTGVDEPVVGDHPDFTVDETKEYYINAVYWKDITDNKTLKETDVFQAGHTYELQVWLRANEGYKFNVDSDDWVDITATVGGKEAEAIGNNIAVILTVTYTLDKADELKLGDVDGDKEISVMDATLIQRSLARQTTLTAEQELRADTDKDSEISVMDATNIQRLLARLITKF